MLTACLIVLKTAKRLKIKLSGFDKRLDSALVEYTHINYLALAMLIAALTPLSNIDSHQEGQITYQTNSKQCNPPTTHKPVQTKTYLKLQPQ
ncbi:MAG: hypothetical protein M1594_02275 [Candidatus Marsarchaeota archaeon]|nr:hypothetical protein [Candidatus Marsarchaeota archaeon]